MPPKSKFTREEISDTAFRIVREKGIGALTARSVAAELDTSTRPIFTHFASMDELIGEVTLRARTVYDEYIDEGFRAKLPFKGFGLKFIEFAKNEPELYDILFNHSTDGGGYDSFLAREGHRRTAIEAIMRTFKLDNKQADWLFRSLIIYAVGVSKAESNGIFSVTMDEVDTLMSELCRTLVLGLRSAEKVEDAVQEDMLHQELD